MDVAASGPFTPGGIATSSSTAPNPFDPKGLNTAPPTPDEQQAITDTLNTIASGSLVDIERLQSHPYQNLPHRDAGAILPPAVVSYRSFNVSISQSVRGQARLVIDGSIEGMHYTPNHYQSFYRARINKK